MNNYTWERVTDNTYRLPVPGGWLYRIFVHNGSYSSVSVSVVFVPDVNTPYKGSRP